ncbi:MAG: preprotein translocase subunit YajC [Planctomycetes bacterium]|nr:preprotein translocase subunit YajC [Planctomycetota bacterium]MCB9869595.1 preprotein translocase subunit YajC [Planctomycetota bacterium]MCB9889852.1 preprotein translocase subunit YajC [Planctomycetota bacterium]
MIGAMFAILYFLMIRPGQKQEKALKAMRAALSKGDVVVTSSGLHGTVHSVDEQAQTVTIQTDPEGRNRLTFDMASIGRKVDRDAPAAKETKKLDNGKPT